MFSWESRSSIVMGFRGIATCFLHTRLAWPGIIETFMASPNDRDMGGPPDTAHGRSRDDVCEGRGSTLFFGLFAFWRTGFLDLKQLKYHPWLGICFFCIYLGHGTECYDRGGTFWLFFLLNDEAA